MNNNVEFAALRSEGEQRAWLADNGCPEHIAACVIENRAQAGRQPVRQQPVVDTTFRDKVRAAAIL